MLAVTALMLTAFFLPAPATDPVSAAGEGCGKLPAVIARVARDWERSGPALKASPRHPADAFLRLRERVDAELLPVAAVSLAVTPPRTPAPGTYAGVFGFGTGAAGPYRISSDEKVWVELVAVSSGEPAVMTHSDRRLRCAGIVKDIVFELDANAQYSLQVTGATRRVVGLMVSPASD